MAFGLGVVGWLLRSRSFTPLARWHFGVLALALAVYLTVAFEHHLVRVW
jgi:hypothetical protein